MSDFWGRVAERFHAFILNLVADINRYNLTMNGVCFHEG
jgi:hypothetical protein